MGVIIGVIVGGISIARVLERTTEDIAGILGLSDDVAKLGRAA